jgi:hypothetical protein
MGLVLGKRERLDEGYRIPIEALWGTVGSGRIILLSMCTVECRKLF